MSEGMNVAYNCWMFKKWSDVKTMSMKEIDEAFGKEMDAFQAGTEAGPLMKEFKTFLENKEWEKK